jgi:hypothetical protein
MSKRNQGLYDKFRVERTDGTSAPGEKHDGCQYFVLDITHDPYAIPALRAYIKACKLEYPLLAHDLAKQLDAVTIGKVAGAFPGDPRGEPR